ncbi:MAG: SPOR domain-containing protein [Candidatus Marinimicrobia bacterium]|nr:SPOR domain-containing protein [Candidatus Neomarinimicrobiota bacterium]
MRKMLYSLTLLVILFQFATGLPDSTIVQDESFDPVKLNEPPISIFDGVMIYEIFTGTNEGEIRVDSVRVRETVGYKVQVFSADDFYLADSLFRYCKELFPNEEVEKVFNSPYYKIRVGNCLTREEAERLLKIAIESGLKDAWIIRTRIEVKENIKKY